MNARENARESTRQLARLLATTICVESQVHARKSHPGNVRDMEAIAATILNRAARERESGMRGNRCAQICHENLAAHSFEQNTDTPLFNIALRIATRALAGVLVDPTEGATRFHPRSCFPVWAKGCTPTAEIGNHLYYREEL